MEHEGRPEAMTACKCFSHNGFITRAGIDQLAQWRRESSALDAMYVKKYLDSKVSVSALDSDEDPHVDTRWITCLGETPHGVQEVRSSSS